jgi:hypothetical protein
MNENEALATEITQGIRGTKRIDGQHVIGHNSNNKAICLGDRVTSSVLREMFIEAASLGLSQPIHVYGSTCSVGETTSFKFHQITSDYINTANRHNTSQL